MLTMHEKNVLWKIWVIGTAKPEPEPRNFQHLYASLGLGTGRVGSSPIEQKKWLHMFAIIIHKCLCIHQN